MVTQGHRRRIIRVTPTLDTNAYAQGDVLFVATEVREHFSVRFLRPPWGLLLPKT